MKKVFIATFILVSLLWTNAYSQPTGGPSRIYTSTDCNQVAYYPNGVLCQDTDDDKLYKGLGAAVEEVGSMGTASPTFTGLTTLNALAFSAAQARTISGNAITGVVSSAVTLTPEGGAADTLDSIACTGTCPVVLALYNGTPASKITITDTASTTIRIDYGSNISLGTGYALVALFWYDTVASKYVNITLPDTIDFTSIDLTASTSSVPWPVSATAAANTVEGTAYWESDLDKLRIGDGATGIELDFTANTVITFPTATATLAKVTSQSFVTPDIGAATGTSLALTGNSTGRIAVTAQTADANVTAAELKGNWHTIDGAHTMTFTEAGAVGDNACFSATTAAAFVLHPHANDSVIFTDGVDHGHDTLTSPATAGSYICILMTEATHWTVMGTRNTFTTP
jgi:hypothetical protein